MSQTAESRVPLRSRLSSTRKPSFKKSGFLNVYTPSAPFREQSTPLSNVRSRSVPTAGKRGPRPLSDKDEGIPESQVTCYELSADPVPSAALLSAATRPTGSPGSCLSSKDAAPLGAATAQLGVRLSPRLRAPRGPRCRAGPLTCASKHSPAAPLSPPREEGTGPGRWPQALTGLSRLKPRSPRQGVTVSGAPVGAPVPSLSLRPGATLHHHRPPGAWPPQEFAYSL